MSPDYAPSKKCGQVHLVSQRKFTSESEKALPLAAENVGCCLAHAQSVFTSRAAPATIRSLHEPWRLASPCRVLPRESQGQGHLLPTARSPCPLSLPLQC